MRGDYVYPIIVSLIAFITTLFYRTRIESIIRQKDNLPIELFVFSTAILAIVITLYAVLVNLLPAFEKGIRKSQTLKDANGYFRFTIFIILIHLLLSLFNAFISSFFLAIVVLSLLILIVCLLYNIILLIDSLFEEVASTD